MPTPTAFNASAVAGSDCERYSATGAHFAVTITGQTDVAVLRCCAGCRVVQLRGPATTPGQTPAIVITIRCAERRCRAFTRCGGVPNMAPEH